ncbi:MAG: topoisomerase DNA-binding C4 zinc finger domain-containing protein, partial [Clostridia bacterium]|nr:topoisomerase DNA-binding C4 zinc finger domain-containing protein [Clostridia bacterium]
KHIKYLKSFLQDFGDVPCFSVVTVICDDFKVDEIGNGDTAICNSLPSMKKVIHLIADNKPVVFDEKRKQEIYDYIKSNQIEGKDSRIEHKENVIRYKENIDEMKEQKICPYCKTDLVLRKGKYGEFYGCSNYPKCRYTIKI